jgi:hypothetical protein
MPGVGTGARFVCSECASEFIATAGGDGEIACCGKPVEPKK